MTKDYTEEDYQTIKDLQKYQSNLEDRLNFFEDTSTITIPEDPIEMVVFQDKAKKAIRDIAQSKGHILMVGKPGTGKSLLAEMFNIVLEGKVSVGFCQLLILELHLTDHFLFVNIFLQ